MNNDSMLAITKDLGTLFDSLIQQKYGHLRAPEPLVTPTGIYHLDTLLGGGIVSSGPVLFNSTPETGKSTFAFQFSKQFLSLYPNGIVIYIDIEGSGNIKSNDFRISRIDRFNLDDPRFRYEQVVVDIPTVYDMIEFIVDVKKETEKQKGFEINVLVIWDSIADTRCSKALVAENPNNIIGLKSRELSFMLEKLDPLLKFEKITFIGIDQVRANINMEGPFAAKEQSTGLFKNRDIKSATGTMKLHHKTQQWIFMSKGKTIPASDGLGIDGWFIDMFLEKSKVSPSKHSVTCVFDKNYGIDKFWSEFYFLMDMTISEKKMYKNKSPRFPLMIKKSGTQYVLNLKNSEDPNIQYKSNPFYRKNAKNLYNTDQEFKQWFDYAVQLSAYYRIVRDMFSADSISTTEENENTEIDNADTYQSAFEVEE
jgi:RecA/RadA recombinase